MIKLSRATGAKFGFKNINKKIISIVLAIAVIFVSYYLLFVVAKGGFDFSGNMMQVILNLFYPIGDIAILMSALLVLVLSYNFLGGQYKKAVFILLIGFILNYIADFIFLFSTTKGTYFNGHISDFLYLTMMFILIMGSAGFSLPKEDQVQKSI